MERNGTTYKDETPAAVVDALERARLNGQRVRLFYGDAATGRAWPEENDVAGRIGRSMGPQKIPLLIANPRDAGGGGVLDSCVVAIATGPDRFTYRHPQFSVGAWRVIPSDLPDYAEAVTHDGEIHARFKRAGQGARYVDFMTGKRMAR